ncbi:type VI secretion system-associated protein TagO [Flexibacterium corallicola]|uniref:type VI secretion system-associated protein TagO n=1 Tax=Flexibacterium corallicola TaxID=3037259 RepID=UPI00286F6708|nr:type VI secretion system-associated protein TagO [Pseudovibrio sp. M1P-2-3]
MSFFKVFIRSSLILSVCTATVLPFETAGAKTTLIEVDSDLLESCRLEADRVDRLSCFDELLGTGLTVISKETEQTSNTPAKALEPGRLEVLANEVEDLRLPDEGDWVVRYRYGTSTDLLTKAELQDYITTLKKQAKQTSIQTNRDASPEKTAALNGEKSQLTFNPSLKPNVYLTTRELPPSDVERSAALATLMISCEEDITTAAVILDDPVDLRRVSVNIRLNSKRTDQEVWRTTENGKVILAPRGLGSIKQISRWFASNRVQIDLRNEGKLKSYLFSISKLSREIKPLRASCHW